MNTHRDYHRLALWLIAGLTLFRLGGLFLSPLGLHGDEAQYFDWSKSLDWGYFTKPPGIAWVIAATTSVFGDSEWAIRLSSPLLHALTTYLIFRTVRLVQDEKTGFWAAAVFMLMPALWLSAGIVSTDVPLLLCWVVALNAWVHLRETPTLRYAVQLGLALGLGMMAKYAMLFFLPALAIAIIFDAPTRRALLSVKGAVAASLCAVIITPNFLWNMQNDFATLSHTAANANMDTGASFHPGELLSFWTDQMAVFGPVTLILLVPAVWAALKGRLGSPAGFLAGFTLSPLIIISAQALLSRANANWAVTAYPAASMILAWWAVSLWEKRGRWLKGGVALQSALCLMAVIIFLSLDLTNAAGMANSVKRLRAWPETVKTVEEIYKGGHDGRAFTSVATDKRIIYYDLKYYGLTDTAPLYMWMRYGHPENHAELSAPLPATEGPVLLLNYYSPDLKAGRVDYAPFMREDFARLEPMDDINIDLGGGKYRRLKVWAGYDYTPTTTR